MSGHPLASLVLSPRNAGFSWPPRAPVRVGCPAPLLPPRAPCSSALLLFCSLPPEVELSLPPQAYPRLHSSPAAAPLLLICPCPGRRLILTFSSGARRADLISRKPVVTEPQGLSLPLLQGSEALSWREMHGWAATGKAAHTGHRAGGPSKPILFTSQGLLSTVGEAFHAAIRLLQY